MQYINEEENNVSEENEENIASNPILHPDHHLNSIQMTRHVANSSLINDSDGDHSVSDSFIHSNPREIYSGEGNGGTFAALLPSNALNMYNAGVVYLAALPSGYSIVSQNTGENLNSAEMVHHESELNERNVEREENSKFMEVHKESSNGEKRPTQHRWRPNDEQKFILESVWNHHIYPSNDLKEGIVKQFGGTVTCSQINSWFKHRREGDKMKGKEVAYKRAAPLKFTPEQLSILEDAFKEDPYTKSKFLQQIAAKFDMEVKKIQNWFKHKRARMANNGKFELKTTRMNLTSDQLMFLKGAFFANPNPAPEIVANLSRETNLTINQISKWFINERCRRKKKLEMEENSAAAQIQSLDVEGKAPEPSSKRQKIDKQEEDDQTEEEQPNEIEHNENNDEMNAESVVYEELIEDNGIVPDHREEEEEIEIEGEVEEQAEELDFGTQHQNQYYNEPFLEKDKEYP